jgi:N-hydroxyarylamine O-acetyltransferase
LNIQAYLERIDYHGSIAPSAGTLRALQLAHLLTVPFENLSIHAHETIVIEGEALFTKIVERRRGASAMKRTGCLPRCCGPSVLT